MFVTVKNDVNETSFPAVIVNEDEETGTALLFIFDPFQQHYESVYAQDHAFQDEDGNYTSSYYVPEELMAPQ